MRDRGEKKGIYERNSVREYWLVDARARSGVRFVLGKDGSFDGGTTFGDGEAVTSTILAGLSIPLAEIFPAR